MEASEDRGEVTAGEERTGIQGYESEQPSARSLAGADLRRDTDWDDRRGLAGLVGPKQR